MPKEITPDQIIDALGGTNAVARLCDIQPPSVSDWRRLGIPKARLMFLRLAKPHVFAELGLSPSETASAEPPPR
jgi:hypothetical protein